MYGETPFVLYTVCLNHVVQKVESSTGGTVMYNVNPWELSWKQLRFRVRCGSFHGIKT